MSPGRVLAFTIPEIPSVEIPVHIVFRDAISIKQASHWHDERFTQLHAIWRASEERISVTVQSALVRELDLVTMTESRDLKNFYSHSVVFNIKSNEINHSELRQHRLG